MRSHVYDKLRENQRLIEALGPISADELDGSYEKWLRYFHFQYETPGMKEAMVLATHAVLTGARIDRGVRRLERD